MNAVTDSPRISSASFPADLIIPIVVKNLRLILAATFVSLLAVYGAILYFSPVYEVSASVLVKLGREMTPPSTAGGTNAQLVSSKRPEDVASEIEIMRSQYLIEQLVREFGIDYFLAEAPPVTFLQKIKFAARQLSKRVKNAAQEVMIRAGLSKRLTPFEQVVATLQNSMDIEAVRKSDVVMVALRTPDRESGVTLLNKFLELYLRQHIEVYKTPHAKTFFQTETSSLSDRIRDTHRGIRQFREQNKVWELGEQRQLLLRQQSDLEALHMKTMSTLVTLDEEIGKLNELRKGMPDKVELSRVSERNPVLRTIDEQLAQLEAQRDQALTKFAPESRVVKDLAEQIASLRTKRSRQEQMIVNQVTSARNEMLADLERNVLDKRAAREGALAQRTEQERQLTDIDKELALLDRSEIDIERMNRESAQLNKNYHLYSDRLEDARISEAMDLANISNVTVVAPATASVLPVWPRKRTWLLAALALGIGGSLGFAFATEMIRPTVRSRGEIVQVAGAPVLGSIPEAESRWEFVHQIEPPVSRAAAAASGPNRFLT